MIAGDIPPTRYDGDNEPTVSSGSQPTIAERLLALEERMRRATANDRFHLFDQSVPILKWADELAAVRAEVQVIALALESELEALAARLAPEGP